MPFETALRWGFKRLIMIRLEHGLVVTQRSKFRLVGLESSPGTQTAWLFLGMDAYDVVPATVVVLGCRFRGPMGFELQDPMVAYTKLTSRSETSFPSHLNFPRRTAKEASTRWPPSPLLPLKKTEIQIVG